MKWILIGAIAILYPIYFGFAMKLNPPFNFPKNVSSSTILKDYVFSNNIGLALFVLTVITIIMLIWELLIKKLAKRVNYLPNIKMPRLLRKFGKWLENSGYFQINKYI